MKILIFSPLRFPTAPRSNPTNVRTNSTEPGVLLITWDVSGSALRFQTGNASKLQPNLLVFLRRRWKNVSTTARTSSTGCTGGRPTIKMQTGTGPTSSVRRSRWTTREPSRRLRSKSRLSMRSSRDRLPRRTLDTPGRTVRLLITYLLQSSSTF